jgi:hypothetical protein
MGDEKRDELPCRSGRVSELDREAFGKPWVVTQFEI